MLERYGRDLVLAGIDEIIAYSERHMRSEIARIPDGVYSFTDYMDTDGATGRPVKIVVTARKSGSEIEFDFTGSDPQVPGAVNCVFTVTTSSVYIGMLMVTDPNIHPSEGAFAPVKVTAPLGTCVNPIPPASTVSGLTETCNRLIDMVFGALSPGIPDRVAAGELGTCNVYTLGGQRAAGGYGGSEAKGENWVAILNPKGGWGGMSYKDGWSCIQDPLSNCRLQPVEALENVFPFKVRRLELRTGPKVPASIVAASGCEGTSRCSATVCSRRASTGASSRRSGFMGAATGLQNLIYLMRHGSDAWEPVNPRLSNLPLKAGDTVRIETAIGGGFGDPLERDPKLVSSDVFDGYLTKEEAEAVYGVILTTTSRSMRRQQTRSRREFRERRAHDGQPETSYPKREPSFTPLAGQAA